MRRSILPFLHLALTFTFCGLVPLKSLTPGEIQDYRTLCQKAAQEEQTYRALRSHELHSKVVEPFLQSNVNSYRLQIDREVLIPEVFYAQLVQLDMKMPGPANPQSHLSLSALLLRHAQIAIELEREFGSLKNLRILQIGSGFGQLAAHLAETTGFGSYTLLDWPECLALQKKFLSSCGVSNITYLEPSQINTLEKYDLVLCAFPFTEWGDTRLRETLLQKMTTMPRGYITCHEPWHPSKPDNSIEDTILLTLARAGHRVFCAPERGDPSPIHSVIRWGAQETTTSDLPTSLASNAQLGSAVIPEWAAGRLGDQLLGHAHTKWIAHHYHLPLLVRPFPYAEGFALSKLYPCFSNSLRYTHKVHPKNHRQMCEVLSTPSTLFVLDFFTETDFERACMPMTGTCFYTNWRDRGFLKSLREDFAPTVDLEKPLLDDSDVHVAVHLRLGGGFDDPHSLKEFVSALKTPPHSFYQQQIKRVASLFPDKSIQVHFFTDDTDPKKLAEQYAKQLNNPRLHFTYRTSQNRHDMHVLDDFFTMSAYDCLICSRSHFSTMAALLGDFAVRITPIHSVWNETHWAVDQVDCEMDGTHPLFR